MSFTEISGICITLASIAQQFNWWVHISQTKLISPRSLSRRCGPLTGRQGGGSVHPLLRSRFGLRRSKGLCFGKASTDEQQETSLSIYYQAILSSWRKALALLIYNDSHLRSISCSHLVTPTWKETCVHLVAHLQRSEWREVMCRWRPSLAVSQGRCLWHTPVPVLWGSCHRIRETLTQMYLPLRMFFSC